MSAYERKYLEDGVTPNPKYKIDPRKGDRHKPRSGDRHAAGYKKASGTHPPSQFATFDFVSIDGEGATIQGEHRYILLINDKGKELCNPQGITTLEGFEFLLESAKENPRSFHVCFGASYDVNMLLSSLVTDKRLLQQLHDGKRVLWREDKTHLYSLEYRPRKSFFIGRLDPYTPFARHKMKGKWRRVPRYLGKMTLWDVFGFFGQSFLITLGKWLSEEEREQLGYAEIVAGKARRSAFSPQELESFILPYTRLEVAALTLLMQRLRGYLLDAKFVINRWDGAGAIASKGLQLMRVKQHYQELPDGPYTAMRYAFGGGHIEAMQYGFLDGPGYRNDIRSAYPAVMPLLPSMLGGRWKHRKRAPWGVISPWGVYNVSWAFPHSWPMYPFFSRDNSGAIFYPPNGRNWVYGPELLAVMRTVPNWENYVTIKEAWIFEPSTDIRPFGRVAELYAMRERFKAESNPIEKVYKLFINAIYGKLVQAIGYDPVTGRRPPYFNLFYGGLITSWVRARIWEACSGHMEHIISIATDGIFSTVPLLLPESASLGDWEVEEFNALTLVQSGVYWMHQFSSRPNPEPCSIHGEYCTRSQFYRGFDKEFLTEERVLEAWSQGSRELPVPTTRFITLGTALQSWDTPGVRNWRTWETQERILKLRATGKREDISSLVYPSRGLVQTRAANGRNSGVHSCPVVFPWDNDYQANMEQLLEHAIYWEIEEDIPIE